ncbi:cystathionine beta-lyase [Thermaurantimonas aggregans]|uniref:Cystathionine beta-lyase n=1 Tax=Thermaurantimonas aggregans TaxID=2173829 RepID=A0A401XHQ2_9FLAO|nr:cystathionine gamma-synthase [Thermaurantimonas aggregans]MCX8149473.1 cystathionine gamma-synthase [Thermaurantimonas aggregans]GCD76540.1 cystathionine beta-lyase [Thermaurantimonas aggregans]
MNNSPYKGFGTRAIHAGLEPDPGTGAVMTPIYQTSTYAQEAPGKHKGYEYSRTHNPTRKALEANLAAIEGGKYGLAFASGLAAIDTLLKTLNPGDEVISTNDLYGGTYRLFVRVYEKFGLRFHFVPMQQLATIEEKITEKTRLIWVETPTNPMLNVIDIEAVAQLAKSKGILLAVDNTFASPYLQQPLKLGADIVMHSATKYIGGHSDLVMGALVVNDDALAEQLYFLQNAAGAVPGPMDCFLALRGIKTLHVRMQRHCENAEKVARFLRSHPKVEKVYWPGFPDHPGHEIAKKQMRAFGGMISFTIKGDNIEEAFRAVSSFKVFTLAESLGGVESLAGHPATMTHASIPREERLKAGLSDSLIRLSVGLEDADDLINDLKQVLQ